MMQEVTWRKVTLEEVTWVKSEMSPAGGKLFWDGQPLTFNSEYIYWG